MSDAGKVYEYYVTQATADAETLKKNLMVNTQEFSEAILNISNMASMFDHGNYAAGGSISVPPGYSYYSGGGGGGAYNVVSSGGAGGSGGLAYTVVPNGYNGNWVEGNYYPPIPPVNIEALAEKIVTQYVPGNPLVICIDNELTSAQMDEISAHLTRYNIQAVIIRGAQAGTGRPSPGHIADEGKRIDILARLAETWERHPDLTFAELIRWWSGENMTDDDFAAATDVYAKKVYE